MPLTLVATPGASDANAYADVTQADAWAAYRVGGAAWAELESDEKIQALVTATMDIDAIESAIGFIGERATSTQALAWPRTGTTYGASVLPPPLVQATIELAMSYAPGIGAGTDVLAVASNGNIKEDTVGPITTVYFEPTPSNAASLSLYPLIVQRLLASLVRTLQVAGYGTGIARRAS